MPFFDRAHPRFEIDDALLTGAQLRLQELRSTLRLRLDHPRVFVHEHVGQADGDSSGPFWFTVAIDDLERVQRRSAFGGSDRLLRLHGDPAVEVPCRLLDGTAIRELLFANDAFEHRRAAELLRQRPQALLAAKHAAAGDQIRRDRRRLHADDGARAVDRRPHQRQRDPQRGAHAEGDQRPPLAPVQRL